MTIQAVLATTTVFLWAFSVLSSTGMLIHAARVGVGEGKGGGSSNANITSINASTDGNPFIKDRLLSLYRVNSSVSPDARCLDGTPPALYWRAGVENGTRSAVLFLEGGGWCYPGQVQQTAQANCAVRRNTPLGSSSSYPPSIPNTGYEGGLGFLSTNTSISAFANWAVAYLKYCDGGSFTGTRHEPEPARNNSGGPIWYRGKFNLEAQLDLLVTQVNLSTAFDEVVLAGCSAGGMACYLHCDKVAQFLVPFNVSVKCICDAGFFLDVNTVTGAGNVMEHRYFDLVDGMESHDGLDPKCIAGEGDAWRHCIFSQTSLRYTTTPTFMINSLYNFGEWEMLAPSWNDTGTPPSDWATCWPNNGGLTPETFATCNATQRSIIDNFRNQFLAAAAAAIEHSSSPHGAFLDSCPNQHCQTSTAWGSVVVNDTTMADAVARWYFDGSVERHIDAPFPSNPTCGFTDG